MNLNIAIIPARAGSKRLENKNIKKLNGKPLIVWTIEAALQCKLFDKILVSTDSQVIANIALDAGAEVPMLRPAELSTDISTTNEVLEHMVNWLEFNHHKVTRVTLLQPTSPLRDADDIINAMELFDKKKALAVISVCELDYPIQFCNTLSEDNSMKDFILDSNSKRSQDYSQFYRLNGAIYIVDRKHIGALSKMYDEHSYAYIMDRKKSVDIDTEDDFLLAQYFIEKMLVNK